MGWNPFARTMLQSSVSASYTYTQNPTGNQHTVPGLLLAKHSCFYLPSCQTTKLNFKHHFDKKNYFDTTHNPEACRVPWCYLTQTPAMGNFAGLPSVEVTALLLLIWSY